MNEVPVYKDTTYQKEVASSHQYAILAMAQSDIVQSKKDLSGDELYELLTQRVPVYRRFLKTGIDMVLGELLAGKPVDITFKSWEARGIREPLIKRVQMVDGECHMQIGSQSTDSLEKARVRKQLREAGIAEDQLSGKLDVYTDAEVVEYALCAGRDLYRDIHKEFVETDKIVDVALSTASDTLSTISYVDPSIEDAMRDFTIMKTLKSDMLDDTFFPFVDKMLTIDEEVAIISMRQTRSAAVDVSSLRSLFRESATGVSSVSTRELPQCENTLALLLFDSPREILSFFGKMESEIRRPTVSFTAIERIEETVVSLTQGYREVASSEVPTADPRTTAKVSGLWQRYIDKHMNTYRGDFSQILRGLNLPEEIGLLYLKGCMVRLLDSLPHDVFLQTNQGTLDRTQRILELTMYRMSHNSAANAAYYSQFETRLVTADSIFIRAIQGKAYPDFGGIDFESFDRVICKSLATKILDQAEGDPQSLLGIFAFFKVTYDVHNQRILSARNNWSGSSKVQDLWYFLVDELAGRTVVSPDNRHPDIYSHAIDRLIISAALPRFQAAHKLRQSVTSSERAIKEVFRDYLRPSQSERISIASLELLIDNHFALYCYPKVMWVHTIKSDLERFMGYSERILHFVRNTLAREVQHNITAGPDFVHRRKVEIQEMIEYRYVRAIQEGQLPEALADFLEKVRKTVYRGQRKRFIHSRILTTQKMEPQDILRRRSRPLLDN